MQFVAVPNTSLVPSRQFEYGDARVGRSTAWPLRGCHGGGIEIVSMRGLITASSLFALSARAAQIEAGDASVAAVSFFTQAIFAATAEDLFAAEVVQVRRGLLRNPRALIVATGAFETFRRYAWMMATEGVGRLAFIDGQAAAALSWARAMGRLRPAPRPT